MLDRNTVMDPTLQICAAEYKLTSWQGWREKKYIYFSAVSYFRTMLSTFFVLNLSLSLIRVHFNENSSGLSLNAGPLFVIEYF